MKKATPKKSTWKKLLAAFSRWLSALVIVIAIGPSCSDAPLGPGPSVYVSLAGLPRARAIAFRYVGRQLGVAATDTASRVIATDLLGDSTEVIVMAQPGHVLAGSPVRVSVPDQAASLASDQVRLLQVATGDYQLQSVFQYSLVITAVPAP